MNHRVLRKPIDCNILLQCLLRVCFSVIQSISLSAQTVPFTLMLEHSAHIPLQQELLWAAAELSPLRWTKKYNSLDVGKRGKELANQLLCQHLNSPKHFWWKDFSKVCYFVKANVSQQNAIFDTAWSRKNPGTPFRCGPLPCQNNEIQKTSPNQRSWIPNCVPHCSIKQAGKPVHTHLQNVPFGWNPLNGSKENKI